MKIGIIGAITQEIIILLNKINNLKKFMIAGYVFYTGTIKDSEVILLESGIGKTSAAIGTTIMLTSNKIDFIINTGSAGALSSILKIGDIVISNEVSYHDVDITAFGYKYGQIADCPAIFTADKKLVSVTKQIIKRLNIKAISGLILSGDTFINNNKTLKHIINMFPQAVAVEMEATAIAHVCYKFNVPFIIIRSISDMADNKASCDFSKFLNIASKNSSLIIQKILSLISKEEF